MTLQSDPAEAKVYVDGELLGNTPVRIQLAANKTYRIVFMKEGFQPKTYYLNNHVGGVWIVLDILAGFWPILVDMSTGSWYEFDSRDVKASMVAEASQEDSTPSPPEASSPDYAQETRNTSEALSVTTKDGIDHSGWIIVDKPNEFVLMQLLDGSIVKIKYRDIDRRAKVSQIGPPAPIDVVALPRNETPLEPLYVFQGKSYAPGSYDLLVNALESERPNDGVLKVQAAKYRTERQQDASLRAAKPLLGIGIIVIGVIFDVAGLTGNTLLGSLKVFGLGTVLFGGVGLGIMVAPSSPPPLPNEIVSYYNRNH